MPSGRWPRHDRGDLHDEGEPGPGVGDTEAISYHPDRAERSTWSAPDEHGDSDNPLTVKYLNRLSDLVFAPVASTDLHCGTADILWMPGGEHGERDFRKVTVPPLDPDKP